MNENDVTKQAQRYGWDHAVNTGHIFNGYTVYKCLEKEKTGVVLTTGLPTYILVKDDEICTPKSMDEYDAIMRLVNGVGEIRNEDGNG